MAVERTIKVFCPKCKKEQKVSLIITKLRTYQTSMIRVTSEDGKLGKCMVDWEHPEKIDADLKIICSACGEQVADTPDDLEQKVRKARKA